MIGRIEVEDPSEHDRVERANRMVLGETDDEIRATMLDLRSAGVGILTLGQYLRPSKGHLAVKEYVTPEKFDEWREEGEAMGFSYVASGPLVRSSYRAGEFYIKSLLQQSR